MSGKVFDVLVDIRENSISFGNWAGIFLSAKNFNQLWIPQGFAHGFLAISDNSELLYKTTNFWKKDYDNFVINYGGDVIKLGETEIKSLHTPGHTPGSTCYHVGNDLIAGDTLFVFGCGRCDLHGGNPEEMYVTLKDIKTSLDHKTIILPGHNYSIKKTSTLKEELEGNPFMNFNELGKFVNYRMVVHDKIRHSPYGPVID